MNDINSINDNNLHNGIPDSTFQSLLKASSGQDLVNKVANSGLSLTQIENEINQIQGQEILDKFGNDSDFQALLNGQTGIPPTTFQNLINASSGQDFINQFANSGLTLAQAEAEILPSQAQEILGKFGSDSNFQAFLHGQIPPPVTVVGVINHEAQHVGQAIQHIG